MHSEELPAGHGAAGERWDRWLPMAVQKMQENPIYTPSEFPCPIAVNFTETGSSDLLYCWSIGMSVSTAKIMMGISETTAMDYFNFLREECATKLISLPQVDKQLGGPGVIVEVDESVLVKRKYHRGAWRAKHQQWLFGI